MERLQVKSCVHRETKRHLPGQTLPLSQETPVLSVSVRLLGPLMEAVVSMSLPRIRGRLGRPHIPLQFFFCVHQPRGSSPKATSAHVC